MHLVDLVGLVSELFKKYAISLGDYEMLLLGSGDHSLYTDRIYTYVCVVRKYFQ